jgi:hypothetical protein
MPKDAKCSLFMSRGKPQIEKRYITIIILDIHYNIDTFPYK